PQRERAAGLMLDIAQAILQNGEDYQSAATDAFQEVVSDLYDGFLSAEDRRGINPPDNAVIPPLVKWANPDLGPYTWPIDATGNASLRNEGPSGDPHPADILRGYLAAEVVRQLTFADAKSWADLITDETDKDVTAIRIMGVPSTRDQAAASARIVAQALVQTP